MKNSISLLVFILFIYHFSQANVVVVKPIDTIEFKKGEMLFSDNFENNFDNWFSELEIPEKSKVSILNHQLDLEAKRGATLWFKEKLSGNYMITYDEWIVDQGGENDRVSDMNVFWMATDPEGGFFHKDGKFPSYDLLHLYYAGIGGNENKTTRFRKYTGVLGDKAVIKEYTDSSHLIKGNKLYQIKIVVKDGRSQLYVNNELYFDYTDSNSYTEGYFGFRTTRSHQRFDNFKVYEIKK
jgi:rhamnogalacturonan endolyase